MKINMCLLIGVLCLLQLSFQPVAQRNSELLLDEMPAYVKAYTEFLLHEDIDPDSLFPIRGYYLFDLNFDDIPE